MFLNEQSQDIKQRIKCAALWVEASRRLERLEQVYGSKGRPQGEGKMAQTLGPEAIKSAAYAVYGFARIAFCWLWLMSSAMTGVTNSLWFR